MRVLRDHSFASPDDRRASVAIGNFDGVHLGHQAVIDLARQGAADRSYGVQVAKLAGLPEAVVDRARIVLEALEKGEREGNAQKAVIDDLPLFSAAPPAPAPVSRESAVDARMSDILPDELSPRDALDLIYELKALSEGKAR